MARKRIESHGAALTDIDEINEALAGIGTAKLWEGKRIYLNLYEFGREHPKLWVELATGELMEQAGRWNSYGTDDDIKAQAIAALTAPADEPNGTPVVYATRDGHEHDGIATTDHPASSYDLPVVVGSDGMAHGPDDVAYVRLPVESPANDPLQRARYVLCSDASMEAMQRRLAREASDAQDILDAFGDA